MNESINSTNQPLAVGLESPANGPKTSVPPSARGPIEEIKNEVKSKGKQALAEAKSGAQESFQEARQAGRGFIRQRQSMLAEKIDEYQQAVHAATESLQREDSQLAGPAGKAAIQLERLAGYLRNHEPEDLLEDLGGFVRRRPEVAFGGLFIAGLVAARFLKASARRQEELRRDRRSSSVRSADPAPEASSSSPAPETHGRAIDIEELAAGRPIISGHAAASGPINQPAGQPEQVNIFPQP
jgi:hypothetical protein